MAYENYLLKVGNYKIPGSMISAESYNVIKNGQDLDSYRDANGKLHRTALSHFVWKIEFDTVPMLTRPQINTLLKKIQENYTNTTEKKATVTFYDPEGDRYVTQEMYMPDIQFNIYGTYNNTIFYNSIRLAFIGY